MVVREEVEADDEVRSGRRDAERAASDEACRRQHCEEGAAEKEEEEEEEDVEEMEEEEAMVARRDDSEAIAIAVEGAGADTAANAARVDAGGIVVCDWRCVGGWW